MQVFVVRKVALHFLHPRHPIMASMVNIDKICLLVLVLVMAAKPESTTQIVVRSIVVWIGKVPLVDRLRLIQVLDAVLSLMLLLVP